MNYGKKGVRRRQKELNAHHGRWGKKIILFALELFLAAFISAGIIGAAAGFGAFKGILASAPSMENIDVSQIGRASCRERV